MKPSSHLREISLILLASIPLAMAAVDCTLPIEKMTYNEQFACGKTEKKTNSEIALMQSNYPDWFFSREQIKKGGVVVYILSKCHFKF